ncbi:MAG: Strongly-conserved Zn-finger binding protein (TFIIIA) [Bogoriella megaspora]|nr:MAG: Strongly-conserved Zn-finger binding protein (TFIIIA) [Bogoriella megaspora]
MDEFRTSLGLSLGKRKRNSISAELPTATSKAVRSDVDGTKTLLLRPSASFGANQFFTDDVKDNTIHESESDSDDASSLATDINKQQSSVTTPLTLSSDTVTKHVRPRKYICPYEGCAKAFDRPIRLTNHLRTHTDERPFVCSREGCDKAFRRVQHLEYHVKNVHLNQKDFACDWEDCGKTFVTATKLRKHYETHEGHLKHACTGFPPCKEYFRKQSTLDKHIALKHLNQKLHRCTHIDAETGADCTAAYNTVGQLRAHEGRAHGAKKYLCEACNGDASTIVSTTLSINEDEKPQVSFITFSELQDHIKTVHPPTCPYCSLIFNRHSNLNKHIEFIHDGPILQERKMFVCKVEGCGKTFTRQNNLNIHTRSVHEKQKFICGEYDLVGLKNVQDWDGENACGRGFTSKAGLEDHIRTQHQGLIGIVRRRQMRQEQKNEETLVEKHSASALAKLTGVGYAEETGRNIPCIMDSCPYHFYREYALGVHLTAAHDIPQDEVAEMIAEHNARKGGQFWIGGIEREDLEQVVLIEQGIRSLSPEGEDLYQRLDGFVRGDDEGEGEIPIDPVLAAIATAQQLGFSSKR